MIRPANATSFFSLQLDDASSPSLSISNDLFFFVEPLWCSDDYDTGMHNIIIEIQDQIPIGKIDSIEKKN